MVNHSIQVYARLKDQGNSDQIVVYDILKKEEKFDDIIIYNNFIHLGASACRYRFHKVFDQKSTQEDLFDTVAKPVINSVLQGFNGTIFAYGQTGSGKTYSITGSPKNYNDRGIIPRSIQYVFAQNEKVTIKPTVYISYMEIYNEVGYDLLSSRQDNTARSLEELPRIVLLEDSNGEVHMRNLSVLPVTTEQEAMRLLFLGDTNRIIAETPMNEYSSRSHCIFTIYIAFRDEPSNILRFSKLHLVDLAGSERVCKSLTTGTALREAKHINLSLHYLQQVILALSESKRLHIPYRNSMMTYILKDSLSGNCFTAMLATLALNKDNIQETISTCRFAQRVSLITTAPVINEMRDPQREISFLKTTIEDLRRQISMLSQFSIGGVLDKNQEKQCKQDVEKYLTSSSDELNVEHSMSYIQFCFKLLKDKIKSQNSESKEKQLEYVQSQKTLSALRNTIDTQDQEINSLKKIVDNLNGSPYRLISKKNVLTTHETERNNNVVNYLSEKQDKYFNHKILYNKNLSEANIYDSIYEQENEKQLFQTFLRDPENAKDLEYYTQNLQKKLEMAKIYAETIDQCQKNITYIRQQLQCRLNNTVKNKLIIELEDQQKIYSKSLDDLKTVKNETYHLQSGLKKAEFRTMRMFKNWLERQQGLKFSKSLDSAGSRDSDYSTENSNCQICKSTQNMSRKLSSKGCSCDVVEEQCASVDCCGFVHNQQPPNYWDNSWSTNLCAGPICQPLVADHNQCCDHSASCHRESFSRESIRKNHSNVFNNVRKSGVLHRSDFLCDPETVVQFEKIAPITKSCQNCCLISRDKNWNSLTSMRERDTKAYCCRVTNSEHQQERDAKTYCCRETNSEHQQEGDAKTLCCKVTNSEYQQERDAKTYCCRVTSSEDQQERDANTYCCRVTNSEYQQERDAKTYCCRVTSSEHQQGRDTKAYCCRVTNSEHQQEERYFGKDRNCGTCEQKPCCGYNNESKLKSPPKVRECEYNCTPSLNSLPNIPECYRCPFPSKADVSHEEENENNQQGAKGGLNNRDGQVRIEDREPKNEETSKNIELIKETDSLEFKEFMKTVPLTGDLELDNEIVNFYRSKFCPQM